MRIELYQPSSSSLRPKVLIVEDNELVRVSLAQAFGKLGCEVELAPDGQTALTIISGPFQLVTLDIALPDMSGFDVLRELRKHDQHKRVAVIAGQETTKLGTAFMHKDVATTYHSKPVSLEELQKLISEVSQG